MEWVALITLCIGSALGLRFRVFILLPAIMITMAVITVGALAQGAGIGTISVMNVIGAVCLQFGYLGGVLLWSRTSSRRLGETGRSHPARPFTP
jgi:hypothetical protein